MDTAGWSYNDTFGDKGEDLYVSAFPITELTEPLRSLFIRFVERKLILEYALKYETPPRLNKK